jgi:hypothetical protein
MRLPSERFVPPTSRHKRGNSTYLRSVLDPEEPAWSAA